MRFERSVLLAFVLAAVAVFSGCSSGEEVPGNSNQEREITVIKPKRAENAGGPAANLNTGAAPKPYPGLENGKNPTLDNSNVRIINTANAPVRYPSKRLRDNSELTTSMNKQGDFVESRRFLDHPKLERLDRITKDPKNVRIEVHLRGGKVIKLASGKIKNFRFDSADTILKAAGIEPVKRDKEENTAEEEIMKRKSGSRSNR